MLLSIIDWFNNFFEITPNKIIGFLRSWGIIVPPDKENLAVICCIVIVIVIAVAITISPLMIKWYYRKQKTNKWRRDLIEKRLGVHYQSYIDKEQEDENQNGDIGHGENLNQKQILKKRLWSHVIGKDNRNIYIETRAQNIPPDEKEEPKDSIRKDFSENLMNKYLKDILVKQNSGKNLYYVIAGSGMGKTTFVVNLLKQYINKYTEEKKPYDDIYLFSLGYNDTFNRIEEIDKEIQRKCILILDALDENTEAVNNYEKFNEKLEKLIKGFGIVIVTCRTQFFDDKDQVPKVFQSGYQDNRHGEVKPRRYIIHYISVFNDKEIDRYIKQKFYSRKKRKKAKEIVEKCKSLMVRPLLLSYLDDLIDEKDADFSGVTNIYKILIDKWLEREVNFWKYRKDKNVLSENLKNKLFRFSEELAVEIYKNQYKNGGLFLPKDEMEKFVKDHSYLDYNYKGRSLVNRYASGNIKFAHKSFLEYFLAKQMFEEKISISFEGMDMAKTFYDELLDIEIIRLMEKGAIIYSPEDRLLVIHDNVNIIRIIEHFGRIKRIFLLWDIVNKELLKQFEKIDNIQLVIFNYHNQGNYNLRTFLELSKNWSKKYLLIWGNEVEPDIYDLGNKIWPLFDVKASNKYINILFKDEDVVNILHFMNDYIYDYRNMVKSLHNEILKHKKPTESDIRKLCNELENLSKRGTGAVCSVGLYDFCIADEKFKYRSSGIPYISLKTSSLIEKNGYCVENYLFEPSITLENLKISGQFKSRFIYLLKKFDKPDCPVDFNNFLRIIVVECDKKNAFNKAAIKFLSHELEKSKDYLNLILDNFDQYILFVKGEEED